jgi:8-amino-7-oxononanoate synthase
MPAPSELERRLRARLDDIASRGLTRSLAPPAGCDLSSNDYLQLARHPAIAARFKQAIDREGCGSTGSRLLRGERESFAAIERRFARFKGAERSLFFGSGFLANLAVLSTLPEAHDVILSDERNHASLIDGTRLSKARTAVFPHNDTSALQRLLETTPADGIRFVVVESLFSMDGDFAPLTEYARLCAATGAVLVVDEAHAVGIYGSRGSGRLEALDVRYPLCVSVNTAGKALGVGGAFVAGSATVIEYLVQRARPFVYSTAPPPALADALDASLSVVEEEPDRRERLLRLSAHLRDRLRAAGLEVGTGSSQIVPVVVGGNQEAVALADLLQRAGYDVRAIRPPSVPEGTARLRVSVNVGASEPLLDEFVGRLSAALKEMGLCSAASS